MLVRSELAKKKYLGRNVGYYSAFLLVILFVVAALLSGCGSGSTQETEEGESVEVEPLAIAVTMKDDVFEPLTLTAKVGQQIDFTLVNSGTHNHNMRFVDTEFQSDPIIFPGETKSLSATFGTAGQYTYICDLHAPLMFGTITVEE